MTIFNVIVYLSIFFWLLPPFRQYKGEYFYFFFLLAITDPIGYVISHYGFSSVWLYVYANILMLLSLFYTKFDSKIIGLLALLFLLFSFIYTLLPYEYYFITCIIINFIIIVIILKKAIVHIFNKYEINFFHFILLLYLALIITRSIAVLVEIQTGTAYHLLTGVLQIFIAIFFTLVREDKPKLAIMLKQNT